MAYKFTSEMFTIRGTVTETVLNTFAQATINTNLDSISREILIILRADLDFSQPDNVIGVFSRSNCQLTNTTQTGIIGIDNPDTIVAGQADCDVNALGGTYGFKDQEPEHALSTDDPLYIVATDDLFIGVQGTNNNANFIECDVMIQCRRAKADANTYAAILTSQFA